MVEPLKGLEKEGLETWKNLLPGTCCVVKTDQRGNETMEIVPGGRAFSISKADRLLNQDRAATPRQDSFQNGMLSPVRLLDGDEDAVEFASNPNLMGESDMTALLKGHWKTIEKKVYEITNPVTIERLVKVGHDVDVSIKTMKLLNDRLDVLMPNRPHEVDTSFGHIDGPTPKPRPVSPK